MPPDTDSLGDFPAPTPAQVAAWPAIRAGQHTLAAAPTGSGKTLTAFLAAIRDGEQHLRRRCHQLHGIEDPGCWLPVRKSGPTSKPPATADHNDEEIHSDAVKPIARTLLRRYRVVSWNLLEREAPWLPPWRELARVYHRLEVRGDIRGGRFVEGLLGAQFALPEATATLRAVRQQADDGELQQAKLTLTRPAATLPSAIATPITGRQG